MDGEGDGVLVVVGFVTRSCGKGGGEPVGGADYGGFGVDVLGEPQC